MSQQTNETDARRHDETPEADSANACSICGRPVAPSSDAFPFCSPRCRMIDLGRWLGGRYVVSRPLTDDDLTNHG